MSRYFNSLTPLAAQRGSKRVSRCLTQSRHVAADDSVRQREDDPERLAVSSVLANLQERVMSQPPLENTKKPLVVANEKKVAKPPNKLANDAPRFIRH